MKIICEWMRYNKFNCDLEIFSGELFAQQVGFKVFDILIDYYTSVEPEMRCKNITLPTNFTFLCDEETTARVDDIRDRLAALGINLGLSASFDGKYMEQNRPYIGDLDIPLGGVRDDAYYDRVFAYGAKHLCGFHPMVYSQGIELWPKNFDWFQEKFKEFNIPWQCIYLLQVRNAEWNQEQITGMRHFIRHLYEFSAEKLDHNPEALTNWVIKGLGFNILSQPYCRTGRGLTCGIQSQFMLRVSDLMSYPCHRTGYKDFYYGHFELDDKEVMKFKVQNVELMNLIYSVHKEALPYCAQCPINRLCSGTCLGSQYESTNNMLVPIPSVCALTYAMTVENLLCMERYGSLGKACSMAGGDTKLEQILALERKLKDVQ